MSFARPFAQMMREVPEGVEVCLGRLIDSTKDGQMTLHVVARAIVVDEAAAEAWFIDAEATNKEKLG